MVSSMTKPIPAKMREELAQDPFMSRCCITLGDCEGRIQWHHNLIFASKRVNEYWAILPVCEKHHREESSHKKFLNYVMCSRAPIDDLIKYSKVIDYVAIKHAPHKD